MRPDPVLYRLFTLALVGSLGLPAGMAWGRGHKAGAVHHQQATPAAAHRPPARHGRHTGAPAGKRVALFHQPLPRPPRHRVAHRPARLPSLNELVVYFRERGIRAFRAGHQHDAIIQLHKARDLKPDDRVTNQWLVKTQAVAVAPAATRHAGIHVHGAVPHRG